MARSRYTSWHWQPTSRVATSIKSGSKRYQAARELQISRNIGEYTMDQVKAALESNIGPFETTKAKKTTAKKVPAKKVAAKKTAHVSKGKASESKATVAPKAANGTALKSIVPASMDTKTARRILRKAGIKGHDAKARWVFTDAQVVEVKKILTGK